MAQSLYSGIQGSGKSYEVVQGVIVPNVAKGRRVVTNVAGLQYDKISDYCVDVLGADRAKLGAIVQVENSRIEEPFFFPQEESDSPYLAQIKKCSNPEFLEALQKAHLDWCNNSIVKGGDIVIIDECWRFYTSDAQLPDGHLKFFRMHRHFLHQTTGQCCDIVLIAQDIGDLRRNIKATIEKSFLMQKHTDLGMPDRYVVSVYGGNKQIKRSFIEDFQKKYDPAIFPLYKSHSQKTEGGADAKEERADNRGSLFNRKIIKYGIPLGVIWIIGVAWFMWRFFHREPEVKPVAIDRNSVVVPAVDPLKPVEVKKPNDGFSESWRLVGTVEKNGVLYVLRDGEGRQRLVSYPPAVKVTRGEVELQLPDGSFVSQWSGASQGAKR